MLHVRLFAEQELLESALHCQSLARWAFWGGMSS